MQGTMTQPLAAFDQQQKDHIEPIATLQQEAMFSNAVLLECGAGQGF